MYALEISHISSTQTGDEHGDSMTPYPAPESINVRVILDPYWAHIITITD